MDGLKALDPNRPIREVDIERECLRRVGLPVDPVDWRHWTIHPSAFKSSVSRHIDNAMAKAITQPFPWQAMLATLLAPDIVEAILGGRQPTELKLDGLMKRFPVLWAEQRSALLRSP